MKTISVSQGRKQFSSVINWAEENQDDVIVENRGEAKVVIIPFDDYKLLKQARERRRRKEAIERLKAIASEVWADNMAMSAEEADRVGREVTKEAVLSLEEKGEISFE